LEENVALANSPSLAPRPVKSKRKHGHAALDQREGARSTRPVALEGRAVAVASGGRSHGAWRWIAVTKPCRNCCS
jgi:hypothetical protein